MLIYICVDLNIHFSFQSQLAVKEEIEELKSIVVNPDENEAAQGYGKSSLNIFMENSSVKTNYDAFH